MLKKLKYFKNHILKLKWIGILLFLITMILSCINIIIPYITKNIFDKGIISKNQNIIIQLSIVLIIAYCIKSALNYISNYSFTNVSNKFIANVKEDIFQRILRMPLSFFDNKQSGYILSRINEINSLSSMFSPVVFQFIVSIFTFLGALLLILTIRWQVAIIGIVFMPVFYIITNKTSNFVKKSSKNLYEISANAMGKFQESISGLNELKGLNIENKTSEQIKQHVQNIAKESINRGKLASLGSESITLLSSFSSAIITMVVGIYVSKSILSVGDYFALTSYVAMLYAPVQLFASLNITIQPGLVALSRLGIIYENKTEDEINGNIVINGIENFKIVDMSFRYLHTNREILKNINFSINRGEVVAIVGQNGSGKSTLAKLLLGFYKNFEGEILINDLNIKDVDIDSLRKKIGIISQNIFLFSGSIIDNIKMGIDNVSNDMLLKTLELSGFDDILNDNINNNYSVMEYGKNLSKGQIQKIAIARTIIRDPDVLIFDEATSNLDEKSKSIIENAIKTVYKDKICIIITHDKSMAEIAHKVISISQDGELMVEK